MGKVRKHVPHVSWSEQEVLVLKEGYSTLTHSQLCEQLPGRKLRVIQSKANGLELTRDKPPKRTADQTREAKRKHMAEKRKANPAAARDYRNAYHSANKGRINARHRERTVTRLFWSRALRFSGITALQLANIWKKQKGFCALTGAKLDRTAQLDHKLPLARGGDNTIENLQWTTAQANKSKRDLTDSEFYALCKEVVFQVEKKNINL